MAEFAILDLSQTEPHELPAGDYTLHVVGADGGEYLDRQNKVYIDIAAQVVTIWSAVDGYKTKRLITYPRERIIKVVRR